MKVVGLFACFLALLLSSSVDATANRRRIKMNQGASSTETETYGPAGMFNIGVGVADITGPAGELGMMGYAMINQSSHGLMTRQNARAFVFQDAYSESTVAVVNLDICFTTQAIKIAVVDLLELTYPGVFSHENVMLSSTHTHSGPGGFSWYMLYDATTLGFHADNFNRITNGIVDAIGQAYLGMQPNASMKLGFGKVENANANRSPSAYLFNPAWERAMYEEDGNTDKNMTLLRIDDVYGNSFGMLNWFAVHGTSMNNTNMLISSDNKGYAEYLWDREFNGNSTRPGSGPFVGAFFQSNEGDVSPNIEGAFCRDGTPCDPQHSTCHGEEESCWASGPGKNDVESCQIIGRRQFDGALKIFNSANVAVTQGIDYRHMWVDMSNYTVSSVYLNDSFDGTTCPPAVGDAFAAGTTDGHGAFDFTQGANSTSPYDNPIWNLLGQLITAPVSKAQAECQYPKPIFFNVGETSEPWVPNIVPVQLFKIGQLLLAAVPGEFTTMSGRRLRDTIRRAWHSVSDEPVVPVIAGLANTYTQYITTPEEYKEQRYEGASNLFGPRSLPAYQQLFAQLAEALASGTTVEPGPTPPNLGNTQDDFQPPVLFDLGDFGTVVTDVEPSYTCTGGGVNSTRVEVVFEGASPQNHFEDTFLEVQRLETSSSTSYSDGGDWTTYLTDSDFFTQFKWSRDSSVSPYSKATIVWDLQPYDLSGTYRIVYYGHSKEILEAPKPFSGVSSTFTVSCV